MAGFVAMISVFVVVCVEMFFALKGAGHVHGSEYDNLIGDVGRGSRDLSGESDYFRLEGQDGSEDIPLGGMQQRSGTNPTAQSSSASIADTEAHQTHSKSPEPGKQMDDDIDELDDLDPYTDGDSESTPYRTQHTPSQPRSLHQPRTPGHHRQQASHDISAQNPQRQLLQCLLLEAGILFHSIFIGMAVSVATGTSFVVLLVAISFHQTFEGFALGSRIASLIPGLFTPSSMKPWLMCLAYGTTTPIGQALGLVLHNLYDPASTAGLLMVGITNAISSGLLLFAGLVELLAEDFLSESSYETLRGRRRIEACVAVAGGALLMAFVGAFA